MSRAFTIRTATEADVEQITAIYGYHVLHGTGSFELEAPTVEEMKRRFHHIAERHSPYIVAVREDKPSVVLGYAYAGPFRERKAYDTTVEDSIYVAQAARDLGVGSALLAELINRCRDLGYKQMVSVIGDSENKPSIGLHTKLGFSMIGTMHNCGIKFSRPLDCVFMELTLNPFEKDAAK